MYGGLAVIIAITIIGIGISAIPQADAQTMTNATMPNAVDDNATSNGIDTLVIDVTANDELAGAFIERLVVVRQSGPSGLDVTTAANTHVIYQPSINDRLIANGTTAIYTYTLTLNVTDAMSNTRTETVTADVNITFVFEAGLEAVDDIAATVQNKTVDIDVLVNDVYRGDTLPTVVLARDPNNGTATLSGNTFTYTPNENYTGIDTFVYNLTDADGGIDNATVTIEINADVAPMAVDDNATSNKVDTLYINATANDMPPTALIASLDFGSLYANFTGVGTITHNDTHIIYQPSAQDRLLPDGTEINFQYTIHVPSLELGLTDSTTIEMITATVTITLDAGLEPIDAVDDNIKTTPNTPVEINVTANDTYDRDGPPVVPIILSHPEYGTLNFSADNNTITYTPDADHPGQDTFVYQITDIVNGGTDNATVTVTVTGAPTRAPDIDVEAIPGEETRVVPDIDAGSMITSAMGATMGTIIEGFLASGTIVYTANENASGIDTVLYTVDGVSQGTVYFHINAEGNDRPVLETIPGVQAEEDTVTFQVMSADDDTQTYAIRNAPEGAMIDSTTGAFNWNTTGFEPGDYIFDIIVHDDEGGLDVQKMAITVRDPANDGPTAPVTHRSTTSDISVLITPDIRDPEGQPTSMILAVGAEKGTIREGFLEANIIAYVPEDNGTDIIWYTTSDGVGGAATSRVYVHTGDSDDPDLETIAVQNVDASETLTFQASATDDDSANTTYVMSGAPDGATLEESTGAFSWAPAATDVGDHTFTITAYDGQGGFDTEPVAISVAMPNITNNDPDIVDFDSAARQNNPRFIALEGSDPDGDQTGIILATDATIGNILQDSLRFGIIAYVPEIDRTGTDEISYTVSDGRGGTSTGTIYVHVRDPNNDEPVLESVGNKHVNATETLTFDVSATDAIMIRSDEPSARATTESGHEVLIWSGPPTEDRRLEIVVAVLNPDGDLVEHLNYDFMVTQNGTTVLNEMDVHHHTGQGSRITSALESSSPLDITITLQGLGVGAADNRAEPREETVTFDQVSGTAMIAAHTGGTIREDMPSGMANATADGTEYQVLIWHGPPTEGLRLEVFMAVLNPDGSLVDHLNYDIMVQQDGNDVLNLEDVHHHTGQGSRITSALGSSSPIDTTITLRGFGVGPVADRAGPVGESVTFTQTSGGELMMHGAHSLTFGIRNAPAGATMTHDGTFSWTPETANAGDHEFTIAVHDDAGGFATEDIIVTVTDTNSSNQNPVAPDGAATTTGARTVVPLDITDPDGDDEVTIIAATGAVQGLVDTELFKDAVLAYTPFDGAIGNETITYTVSDGNGGLATGTITITISAPSGS